MKAITLSPGRIRRLPADHDRLDELVGLVALVGVPRSLRRTVGVVLGRAVDEQVIGELDAVPAPVAIHRVVAADHGADAADAGLGRPALDLLEEARAGLRQRVAAVGEGVDHEILDLELLGELDQRVQVLDARVHAAV